MWQDFILISFQGLFYVHCSVTLSRQRSQSCERHDVSERRARKPGFTSSADTVEPKGTAKGAGTTQVNQLSTDESKAFQICRKNSVTCCLSFLFEPERERYKSPLTRFKSNCVAGGCEIRRIKDTGQWLNDKQHHLVIVCLCLSKHCNSCYALRQSDEVTTWRSLVTRWIW